MVVINLKRTEIDQFLYECSINDSNDKVIRELVRVLSLCDSILFYSRKILKRLQ